MLKVVFFLILWFLIGIFILPAFLKKAKKLMNNETLLIVSLPSAKADTDSKTSSPARIPNLNFFIIKVVLSFLYD